MVAKRTAKTAKAKWVFGQRWELGTGDNVPRGALSAGFPYDQQTLPLQMRAMREQACATSGYSREQ
jgi:hypothetical protein